MAGISPQGLCTAAAHRHWLLEMARHLPRQGPRVAVHSTLVFEMAEHLPLPGHGNAHGHLPRLYEMARHLPCRGLHWVAGHQWRMREMARHFSLLGLGGQAGPRLPVEELSPHPLGRHLVDVQQGLLAEARSARLERVNVRCVHLVRGTLERVARFC